MTSCLPTSLPPAPCARLSLAALALLMAAPALAQSRRQGAELPQMRLSQRPLIVAHRGRATPDGAENSLVQMQQVASHQIGVEMDLAASQDGVLYLLHDATLTAPPPAPARSRRRPARRWTRSSSRTATASRPTRPCRA